MATVTYGALAAALLTLANALFTAGETAFVSARGAKLKRMAEAGSAGAAAALEITAHPGRFLGLVQFWLTLSCVLSGVVLVAPASALISSWLAGGSAAAPWAPAVSIVAATLVLSSVMLMFGELLPKRIALASPERTAAILARPMRALMKAGSPVSSGLGSLSEGLARGLGFKPRPAAESVEDDDVRALVERGLHAGVFQRAEKEMVDRVLSLDNLLVTAIMTPRSRIVFLNVDDGEEANWRKIVASGHSYFPVYQNNRDQVIGMVSVKALWAHSAIGLPTILKNLLVPPLVAAESMSAIQLLEQFKKTGRHTAIVSDEFGAVQGMVTLIDVLEAIVGDLPEHGRRDVAAARQREDGAWLVDAALPLSDFKAILGFHGDLPSEAQAEYRTAGGFALTRLGRIPAAGEKFEWNGWKFEVAEMDRRRIDKLVVSKAAHPPAPGE